MSEEYPTNPKLTFEFDRERTLDLIKLAVSLKDRPPFNDPTSFPDAIVPDWIKEGSQRHAMFLFYGVMNDSSRSAEEVYESTRSFNQAQSVMTLHKVGRERLERLLGEHFNNLTRGEVVDAVYKNSRKLKREYDNDPRNIFEGFEDEPTISEVLSTLAKTQKDFAQYGIQKSALLFKNFVRFGMWDVPHSYVPTKVDRHLARISLGFDGMYKFYDDGDLVKREDYPERVKWVRTDKFAVPLQKLFLELTVENDISGIDLDDSLWLLGSKWCHQNKYSLCQDRCPIQCLVRPPSDQPTTYFFPGKDKRRGAGQAYFKWD